MYQCVKNHKHTTPTTIHTPTTTHTHTTHNTPHDTITQDLQHANDSGITSSPPTTRQPVLLLLGGGMAAGKSSVRQLIGADVFWSKVRHPVIVEADAIKSQDAVFHELRRRFPGDPSIAQMVHEYSTEVRMYTEDVYNIRKSNVHNIKRGCTQHMKRMRLTSAIYTTYTTYCTHTYTHTNKHTYIHTYVHTYIQTNTDSRKSACGSSQPAA